MDNLNCPTGFTFYKDGVLLMQAPDLWFVRDTNGDGKADWKERVLMGMDSADSHHTTNAMGLDPGGSTYLSDGVFHRTQVETAVGPLRHKDAIIWRFEPRTAKFEKYAPYGLVNPHGKVWDRWGNDILTNATGNANFFGPAISGHLDEGDHPQMKEFWKRPARPCPGTGMLSSRHFPDDWQGNFLNLNVISDQCIYRASVEQDGSGLKGDTIEKLVYGEPAELPTFRPICVSTGPEGALYFCDWSQTIIGHLQHHLRDPNRDHQHGRIYRITYNGRPLLQPVKIDGQPIEALLDVLKVHEDDTRTLAKVELGKHDSAKVIAALKKWAASLDQADKEYEHHLTEALWVHQWHNVVDADFLRARLKSPNPQARAAAVRVLCYWRDRVPDALALLKVAAVDEDPRVRLHAVRAASFFKDKQAPEAIQVALNSLGKPSDYYLDYVFKETMRQLRTQTKENVLPSDPVVLAAYVGKLSDKELAAAPDVEGVLAERIGRKSTDAAIRDAALTKLASLRKTDKTTEIVAALQRSAAAADDLAKALTTATPADLGKARAALTALASNAEQKPVRRAATAALLVADANPSTSWAAAKDDAARQNIIEALGGIADPTLRAKFQPVLTTALTNNTLRSAALRALPLMGAENARANFAVLAASMRDGKDRTIAARALMQLPRDSWDKAAAQPVAESILTWAKTVPAGDRTKQDYIEITQLGGEMASLLPPADAGRIRKELRGLGVAVFVLHTVHEQMRYDQNRLVVEAGKPFEIILENPDTMPHNLVVVKPGAHEKVGMASATMTPDKLDKQGRAFLPKSDDIIEATKLVEPGQKDKIKIPGISQEGIYEYVCTVPGHFAIMWGKLVVTKDVDAYLAANPISAGASVTTPHQH
jgi:azurin